MISTQSVSFYQLVVLRASHSWSLSPLSISPIVCWRGCHIVIGLSVPILSVTRLIVTGLSVHLCPFVSMCVHFCPTYFGDVIPHNVVTGEETVWACLVCFPAHACLSVCLSVLLIDQPPTPPHHFPIDFNWVVSKMTSVGSHHQGVLWSKILSQLPISLIFRDNWNVTASPSIDPCRSVSE